MSALRTLAVVPIRFYQRAVSPALPRRCKYHPTCSEYAVGALRRYGVLRGIVLALWRLLRCNPWSHGGVDFVEDQTLFRPRTRSTARWS
jgi:putative membrane protein insertion efficiency factor